MSTSVGPSAARELASELLADAGDRWLHVQAVGAAAEDLVDAMATPLEGLVAAAWLHDIGYADSVRVTGFHPLDGARYLQKNGCPAEIVSLVAYHSGAEFEAEARGLAAELAEIQMPNEYDLAVLTLLDFTNGPTGLPTTVTARIDEILSRYDESDPVHLAVTRSRPSIIEACSVAQRRTGYRM